MSFDIDKFQRRNGASLPNIFIVISRSVVVLFVFCLFVVVVFGFFVVVVFVCFVFLGFFFDKLYQLFVPGTHYQYFVKRPNIELMNKIL